MKQNPPHQPNTENMRETYLRALDELAKPYPSITLNDWPLYNKMVGGFRMNEFSILCGPTGKGKTTFLANLSAQLAVQNVKHFVMSIECGETAYLKRVLGVWEGEDLDSGDPVPKDKLTEISGKYLPLMTKGSIEFSKYSSRIPLDKLKADIVAMIAIGCKIVFIDNLNYILKVTRNQDQIIEMDRVIHDLIEFVKENNVHVVMVMHPKKTEDGRVDSEFDIKGSSTAVQEAQNVFLFNPPTKTAIKNGDRQPFDRELKITKSRRRGKYVGTSIIFRNNNTRYTEVGYA